MTDNKSSNVHLIFLVLLTSIGSIIWLTWNVNRDVNIYRYYTIMGKTEDGSDYLRIKDVFKVGDIWNEPKEYIQSTSALTRLDKLNEFSKALIGLQYPFGYKQEEHLRLAAYPIANQTLCDQHLKWILKELDSHPKYYDYNGLEANELTKYMDSFGKQEVGFFANAATFWVGSRELCSQVSLDKDRIKTRYCLSKFRFKTWASHRRSDIKIGICLPETCDTLSFESQKEAIDRLAKIQLSSDLKTDLEPHSLYCMPDERSPIRQLSNGALVFLSLVGAWISIIVLCSSLHELLRLDNNKAKISAKMLTLIKCFSLRNCIKTLAPKKRENPIQESRVDLRILDSFRFLMAISIIHAHCTLLVGFYTIAQKNLMGFATSNFSLIAITFGRFVDTFLLIFGLLTSYVLLNKYKLQNIISPGPWFMTNLNVTIKIIPIFAFLFWFSKLILPYLGDGSFWDYGFDNTTSLGNCIWNNQWYEFIPQFSNLGDFSSQTCVPTGWFLAVYSQILLLLPLIIFILASLKSEISRIMFAGFFLVISAINSTIKMKSQKVLGPDTIADIGGFMVMFVDKYESSGYFDTIGRLGVVVTGSLFGYYLYKYKTGDIKQWPRWFGSGLTSCIIVLLHVSLCLMPLLAKKRKSAEELTMAQFSVMLSIFTSIWPILNGWLIVNIATHHRDNMFIKFLKQPFWHTLNKLKLAIYLIHFQVILYFISSSDEHTASFATVYDALITGLRVTLTSVFLASIVYLLIEAPTELLRVRVILPMFERKSDITRDEKSPGSSGLEQVLMKPQ